MHRFTSNPPSRQLRPFSVYIPSQKATRRPARSPLHIEQDASDVRYMPTEDILASFDRYFARTGMAPSAIGRMLANDPALFSDMRKRSRKVGQRLRSRLVRFLEESAHA